MVTIVLESKELELNLMQSDKLQDKQKKSKFI